MNPPCFFFSIPMSLPWDFMLNSGNSSRTGVPGEFMTDPSRYKIWWKRWRAFIKTIGKKCKRSLPQRNSSLHKSFDPLHGAEHGVETEEGSFALWALKLTELIELEAHFHKRENCFEESLGDKSSLLPPIANVKCSWNITAAMKISFRSSIFIRLCVILKFRSSVLWDYLHYSAKKYEGIPN